MKAPFSLFLVAGLLAGGVALAQETPGQVAEAETVTLEDLEVQDVGLLPTSPFYFFKEWGRGVQSFFTFNKVAKAVLELRFTNEKAAEVKAVEEKAPQDALALEKALANYQKSQERLYSRLRSLQETSENPNVERLVQQATERAVLHEKLFEELQERHKEKTEVKAQIENAKTKIEEVVGEIAKKDTPEKFAERLQKILEKAKESTVKDIQAVEILDRFGKNAGEAVKEKLDDVRETFKKKAQDRIRKGE